MTLTTLRARPLVVLVGVVVVAALCVSVAALRVSSIDRDYRQQLDAAWDRMADRFADLPTGLAEKDAALASRPAGITASQRVSLVIADVSLLASARIDVEEYSKLDPPRRWAAYHRAWLGELQARVELFEAKRDQAAYAEGFLGERPTPARIVALDNDAHYVELVSAVEAAYTNLNYRSDVADEAFPRFGRVWGPERASGDADVSARNTADEELDEAVGCAAARLAGVKSPSERCTYLLERIPERPPTTAIPAPPN
jgi:hypothetical protein